MAMGRGGTLRAKAMCLLIGALGGLIFFWLNAPLPWMLGAMCATTIAAISGVRVIIMPRLRMVFIAILGVMLGSAFTPAIVEGITRWFGSFLWLGLYVVVATYVIRWFYVRAGFDRVTAYFAAAPGGLSEMILAGAAFGGDERRISLSHGARIFIAVFALSFGYRWLGGYHPVAGAGAVTGGWSLEAAEWALLVGIGVIGFALARLLRLPAYALVGPMLLSALLHGAGVTHSRPPFWLVALAQMVVGSMVGARFDGIRAREVASAVILAAIATAILLLVAIVFGLLVSWTLGIPFGAALLAFAPGGLAEMSLIALSLNIDAAYVSSHHVVRIVMIVVAAPMVFRLFGAKR